MVALRRYPPGLPTGDYVGRIAISCGSVTPTDARDAAEIFFYFAAGDYPKVVRCAGRVWTEPAGNSGVGAALARAYAVIAVAFAGTGFSVPGSFLAFEPEHILLLAKLQPGPDDPSQAYNTAFDNALLLHFEVAFSSHWDGWNRVLPHRDFAGKLILPQ